MHSDYGEYQVKIAAVEYFPLQFAPPLPSPPTAPPPPAPSPPKKETISAADLPLRKVQQKQWHENINPASLKSPTFGPSL